MAAGDGDDFLGDAQLVHQPPPEKLCTSSSTRSAAGSTAASTTVLSVMLTWLLPVLVAIVVSAAMERLTLFQAVVASISPLATLLAAGLMPIGDAVVQVSESPEFATVRSGFYSGLGFLAAQIVLLGWRWQVLRKRLN